MELMREIDRVMVKGIDEGLPIYEPMNKASTKIAKTYALALAKYRDREFDEAISIWERLLTDPTRSWLRAPESFLQTHRPITRTSE